MRTPLSRDGNLVLQRPPGLPGNGFRFVGATACLAALIAAPTTARALGVRIPNQDAEAIARGNAFVATADNPSALYYNPAGITQLDGQNIQLGLLNYMGINVQYQSPTGSKSVTEFEIISVPQIYYAYKAKDLPIALGLGVYAPFGLSLEWPETSGFRTLAIQGQLQYVTFNPVFAWQILTNLSVAIGPTANYSKLQLRQGIALPFPYSDEFNFDGDDWGFGFNAGILWQPHPKWSLGANYRSATTMNYSGTASTWSILPVVPSASTSSSTEFQFPQIISAGVSFRPTPEWNLEFNADYTDWNTLNTVVFRDTPLGDIPLVLNWHGSWFYELGASHYFPSGYFLSAGYFFSGNSTSEENFNPTVPDTNLSVFSFGGGFKGEHWRWAAAFQLITGAYREIRTAPPNPISGQSVDGDYKLTVPALTVSVGYHF